MNREMNGRPQPSEIERITNVIVDALGTMDLEGALTVICNLAGQLIASMSEGKPSLIQKHGNIMADNIKKAAITKMLYDDNRRREQEQEEEE